MTSDPKRPFYRTGMVRTIGTKGILREELAEGASRTRAEDPLFAAWVELVVPR